ncbi:uncharacterized protein LOC143240192 [Tachypleus tridentatus]|uniref:uncharacterized protein LOC143240192 n=1 Tax=Tachypleus tridentatus TaxID=6853 RepID=UPI003FD3728B
MKDMGSEMTRSAHLTILSLTEQLEMCWQTKNRCEREYIFCDQVFLPYTFVASISRPLSRSFIGKQSCYHSDSFTICAASERWLIRVDLDLVHKAQERRRESCLT